MLAFKRYTKDAYNDAASISGWVQQVLRTQVIFIENYDLRPVETALKSFLEVLARTQPSNDSPVVVHGEGSWDLIIHYSSHNHH